MALLLILRTSSAPSFRNHQRMSREVFPSWQTLPLVCQCWPARCFAYCTTVPRWPERRRPVMTCFAQSYCKGKQPIHCTAKCLPALLIKLKIAHCLACSWTPVLPCRCQWQVEANGAISPALTPSPSPLPLTIEEDREFTYPSDVLVPPPGLMPGTYFDLPRIRLPPGIMGRLREVSGRARPQFRPSLK